MASPLDDATLTVLYHALGANLSQGLELFETTFREAAADYRLDDIDALLDLLIDPTLEDERRLAWHHYYTACKALLQWRPQEVEESLGKIEVISRVDAPLLQCRLELLRGQVQVMRSKWAVGRETMRRVIKMARSAGEAALEADAEEWIARAYIDHIQSAGGWEERRHRGVSALFGHLLTAALSPLYVLIWIYLWLIGAREFWRSVLRYGADYSNWSVFWYYLRASQALARAKQVAPTPDPDRSFRLEIMRADLLRRLPNARAAVAAYTGLVKGLPPQGAEYQAALVKHGLAQALLDLNEVERAQVLLSEARAAYDDLSDARATACVDLLLGDVALHVQSPEAALTHWDSSLRVFDDQQDSAGLAQGLGRCYSVLEGEFPMTAKDRALALVRGVRRKVFAVRLPNRLFGLIQLVGWVAPLLAILTLAVVITDFIYRAPRKEMSEIARVALSTQGALATGGIVLTAVLINTALGLIGLASTLWMEAMHLDFIVVDEMALYRYDFAGREQARLPWSGIEVYLRVERALGSRPTSTLSFDYIRTTDGEAMRLPGTTAGFGHLQQEVERRAGRRPQRLCLRWFGVLFIALAALMGVTAAVAMALTDAVIPGVSVAAHAWLASLLTVGGYLIAACITGSWISHYVKVYCEVTPASKLIPIASLVSVALIALGVFGRLVIFLWGPHLIFWGAFLWFTLIQNLRHRGSRRQWWLASITGGIVLALGLLLVLHSLLPILINMQAFTYAGAAGEFDPDYSFPDPMTHAMYFERMGDAGEWMVRIDSTYFWGYGYIGYAHYFRGDYEASVAAYDRAIHLSGARPIPDYFYCRALAHDKQGDETRAEQDCQAFAALEPSSDTVCERLFPEDVGVCEMP